MASLETSAKKTSGKKMDSFHCEAMRQNLSTRTSSSAAMDVTAKKCRDAEIKPFFDLLL